MEKLSYMLAVLIGIAVSNSCAWWSNKCSDTVVAPKTERLSAQNNYGAYLAGRVAHIRHDLNRAADYYIIAAEDTPANQAMPNQLYIILASQGRVDEAVKYAEIAQKNGDSSPFIHTLKATYETKQGNYEEAIKNINNCDNPFAHAIFNPLINAWNYAALNQYDQAIKSLSTLLKNPSLKAMYFFHAGAISDYLGKNVEAEKYYDALLGMKGVDLAAFPLQVVSNFYLRINKKYKALEATGLNRLQTDIMMNNIIDDIKKADSNVKPILMSADVGMAEALLSIALLLSQDTSNDDLSLLFASLAYYINPDYKLPQLLIADILERKEIYRNAIEAYDMVPKSDYVYYSAQFQKAKVLTKAEQYEAAEKVFKRLAKEYNKNPDILTNLGEVSRMQADFKGAIGYYLEAIEAYPANFEKEIWPVYFALGVSYDSDGQPGLAEKYLRKVLAIEPNKIARNHLGYVLLQRGKNIEEALELIIAAYNESSEEGNIADSLGWALYKIGKYDLAVQYLEKASNLSPSEAVIYDHVGDAYWQSGRTDEAVYQWNHALALKDKSGELEKDKVLSKIENGLTAPIIPAFDKDKVEKLIETINKD